VTIKHKILKDFQLLTSDKKIVILKSGSILEEYKYGTKSDSIKVDRTIVDSNPDFFQLIDWKIEIVNYMKQQKIAQPAQLAKKLIPFLEDMVLSNEGVGDNIDSQVVEALEQEYKEKQRRLKEKEIEWDAKYEKVLKREKEIELELEERESKLDKKERETKNLMENLDSLALSKEKELEAKWSKRGWELEEEWELKFDKITKRDKEIKQSLEELEEKEKEISKKISDLKDKEEKVREFEYSVKQREMGLDKSLLESQQDLDSKQKEMFDKVKNGLKELSEKESEHDRKMNDLEEREKVLLQKESKFLDKIKELENQISEKQSQLEDKVKQIAKREEELSKINVENLIEEALTNFEKSIPWQYHRRK